MIGTSMAIAKDSMDALSTLPVQVRIGEVSWTKSEQSIDDLDAE